MTSRTFHMWKHNEWGDSIRWQDSVHNSIVGWLSIDIPILGGHGCTQYTIDLPKTGDEVWAKMISGAICRYEITSHEWQSNPHDMFFADVKNIGFVKYGLAGIYAEDNKIVGYAVVDTNNNHLYTNKDRETTNSKFRKMMKTVVIPSEVLF